MPALKIQSRHCITNRPSWKCLNSWRNWCCWMYLNSEIFNSIYLLFPSCSGTFHGLTDFPWVLCTFLPEQFSSLLKKNSPIPLKLPLHWCSSARICFASSCKFALTHFSGSEHTGAIDFTLPSWAQSIHPLIPLPCTFWRCARKGFPASRQSSIPLPNLWSQMAKSSHTQFLEFCFLNKMIF